MELTPLDIRNQTFHKKNFGGIDPEEVKAFLETAAGAFEQMSRDKTDLTERLKVAEERVNYYRQIEKTIQDAVVTMQRTVDEVKATAEKEAEIIVAEAKARAVREVESTKRKPKNSVWKSSSSNSCVPTTSFAAEPSSRVKRIFLRPWKMTSACKRSLGVLPHR